MENSPRHVSHFNQKITRKAVRSVLKRLDDAMKLGAHPLAALRIVDLQRAKANYPDDQLGRGLALRELLRTAVEMLRPNDGAPKLQAREWRHYLVAQEYVMRGNPHDLQMQMGIAASTYDHEQAAMLDRLAVMLSEWEIHNSGAAVASAGGASRLHTDWGERRDVTGFCGRTAELARVRRWVLE